MSQSTESPVPEEHVIRSTVERHVERLVGGSPKYSIDDISQLLNVDPGLVSRFWVALGFPAINDRAKRIFTDQDLQVMNLHLAVLRSGDLSIETLNSLVRAQSHMADRLVLWQHEALVEEAIMTLNLDDTAARYWVLDHISNFEDFLQLQMLYVWKRVLAGFLRRSELDIQKKKDPASPEDMPLQRALGFVDMVAFTNRSNQLESSALVEFITTFEFTCRNIISAHGARLVKTIGDAVLYIADDLETGAAVVTEIVEALRETAGMPPVRASLTWGGVVSRFGDVFGAPVNLASRLVDVAAPGAVLVDGTTAQEIEALPSHEYTVVDAGSEHLKSFGEVKIYELHKEK